MALSTSIPTANAKPAIEMTLSVMPIDDMKANVAINDVGIAVATMSDVVMLLKKASKTKKTMTMARTHVSLRLSIELSMYSDWSLIIL